MISEASFNPYDALRSPLAAIIYERDFNGNDLELIIQLIIGDVNRDYFTSLMVKHNN